MNIFNRNLLRQNRNRAAKNFSAADFIIKEVANRLIAKLTDLNFDFESILEIGGRDGFLGKEITDLKKSKFLTQTEISEKFLDVAAVASNSVGAKHAVPISCINIDDESLSFPENSFDLVISNMNMHFINDVPAFLMNVKKMLKPKGLFIASFFGGETLKELREVFYQIEQEEYGAVSPRIAPFIHVKDAGMLMQKAGFANSVADLDVIEVSYSKTLNLFRDLKNMGEANILEKRSKKFVTKKFLENMEKAYKTLHSNEDGEVNASFEIITITGWKN